MNPFSGFLQPQNNRPLEGLATPQDVLRLMQDNKQLAQRKLENEQQNTRANEYLKLQQGDQAHRFSAEEQKQVEGLLAEYQDAEDQGDPIRLSRAAQMLQRFGMNVGQKQVPDLRAFTGERALPDVKALTGQPPQAKPDLQALTGKAATKPDIQALTGQAPEQDLSQEEWEKRLIENPLPEPSRYEQDGQTTAEYRKMLPQAPEDAPVDMGDVDSPEFKQSAHAEGETTRLSPEQEAQFQAWAKRNGIRDANDPRSNYDYRGYFIESGGAPHRPGDHFPDTFKQHGHETFSVESRYSQGPGDGGQWDGEKFIPPQAPRRLPTQLLPTVISKGGKQLYESTGPSGRWSPMVQGVFEPFTQHENPEIASAAKRAQQVAAKLISVDGVAPKDAIKMGMDYLKGESDRIVGLERTRIGSKPKGGGAAVLGGISSKLDNTLNDDLDKVRTMFVNSDQYKNVVQKRLLVDGALGQLQSGNGMSQQEAVSTLRRIQSGLTLNAFETQEFNNAAGAIEGIYNKFNKMFGGGQLSPEYKRQLQEVYARINKALDAHTERLSQEAYDYWMSSRARSAPGEIIQEKGKALKKSLRGAPIPDPNADLDQ